MQQIGLFVLALLALGQADPIPKPLLRGVTVIYEPYVMYTYNGNGTLEGFAIDLIEKISEKAGFDYNLTQSSDGKFGTVDENGTINGMLGDVKNQKFDFALAPFTVTEDRKQHVAFTEAFLNDELAGIGRWLDFHNIANLEEVVKKNEAIARSDKPEIKFSFLKSAQSGSTNWFLNQTPDPIGMAMLESAVLSDNLVRSNQEGYQKARAGGVVHLTDASAIEYVTARDCHLVKIPDNRGIGSKEFAVALPKGSPHLDNFNKAIRELKADGTIAQLKHRHWFELKIVGGPCKYVAKPTGSWVSRLFSFFSSIFSSS